MACNFYASLPSHQSISASPPPSTNFIWICSQQNYLTAVSSHMPISSALSLEPQTSLLLLILSIWMVDGTKAWEYGRHKQFLVFLRLRKNSASFCQHLTIACAAFSSMPCSGSCGLKPHSVLCLTQHQWGCCGLPTCSKRSRDWSAGTETCHSLSIMVYYLKNRISPSIWGI